MAISPITKSLDKTQDWFCCLPKTSNQREAETTHSLFENVKGKSSQDRNKHKNSVKCEHFIFGLGDLGWWTCPWGPSGCFYWLFTVNLNSNNAFSRTRIVFGGKTGNKSFRMISIWFLYFWTILDQENQYISTWGPLNSQFNIMGWLVAHSVTKAIPFQQTSSEPRVEVACPRTAHTQRSQGRVPGEEALFALLPLASFQEDHLFHRQILLGVPSSRPQRPNSPCWRTSRQWPHYSAARFVPFAPSRPGCPGQNSSIFLMCPCGQLRHGRWWEAPSLPSPPFPPPSPEYAPFWNLIHQNAPEHLIKWIIGKSSPNF